MNRRRFLRGLVLAPVAAPFVAKDMGAAKAAKLIDGRTVREWFDIKIPWSVDTPGIPTSKLKTSSAASADSDRTPQISPVDPAIV